jgi:hypothetical protein
MAEARVAVSKVVETTVAARAHRVADAAPVR